MADEDEVIDFSKFGQETEKPENESQNDNTHQISAFKDSKYAVFEAAKVRKPIITKKGLILLGILVLLILIQLYVSLIWKPKQIKSIEERSFKQSTTSKVQKK